MNLESFKKARESYFNESLNKEEAEELYEFFTEKYFFAESLNEGIFTSMVNWFKRNFSPKASKIRSLGNDYKSWLLAEYNSSYKGDDENSLDKFLKSEKISSDIEEKINATAGDDDTYQMLAKNVILENKIKAKKEFSTKILGSDSKLTREYASAADKASSDVENVLEDLSSEDTKTFKERLKELTVFIKKDGKNSEISSKLASGIMIFLQNRKNLIFKDYSATDAEKEYTDGEKVLLSVKKNLNNKRGAEIIYSIRSFKDKVFLESKIDAKVLSKELEKIETDLKDVGVDMEKNWGLAELYLRQPSDLERKKTLDFLKEKVQKMSDEQKEKLAEETEKQIDQIDQQTDDLEKQQQGLDKIESQLSKQSEEKTPEKAAEDEKETKSGESKEDSEKPAEEEKENKASKAAEKIKAASDHLTKTIENAVVSMSSAIEKNGKFYLSPKLPNKSIIKQVYSTSDPLDPSLIEFIKKTYIVDNEDEMNPKFNEEAISKAAESFKQDLLALVDKYKEAIENAPDEEVTDLFSDSSLVQMFLAKSASVDEVKPEEFEKIFFPIVKYWIVELAKKK
jgi:hypothetical protein